MEIFLGDPNLRGYPTWNILPDEFTEPLLTGLLNGEKLNKEDFSYAMERIGKKI